MAEYEVIGGCKKCGGALDTRNCVDLNGGGIWKKLSYCINCGSSGDTIKAKKSKKNERRIVLLEGQKPKRCKKKARR